MAVDSKTMTPAQRRQKRRKARGGVGPKGGDGKPKVLSSSGTGPNGGGGGNAGAVDFDNLMEESIRENWTDEQLRQAAYDSPKFKEEFPGYFREDGSTVFEDGAGYKDAYEQYIHVAAQYGVPVSKDQFAGLMYDSISASEFSSRLDTTDRIMTLAKESPGGLDAFAKTMKEMGVGNGSFKDILEFAAGTKEPELYNLYETTQIKAGGLDIGTKEAYDVSKLIGDGTGAADLKGVIGSITDQRTDINPELKAAGISESDILKARAGGVDKTGNLENRIKALVAQRRAFGADRVRKQTGYTAAGTVATRGLESGEGSA